jgi:hypothetical protein
LLSAKKPIVRPFGTPRDQPRVAEPLEHIANAHVLVNIAEHELGLEYAPPRELAVDHRDHAREHVADRAETAGGARRGHVGHALDAVDGDSSGVVTALSTDAVGPWIAVSTCGGASSG